MICISPPQLVETGGGWLMTVGEIGMKWGLLINERLRT